jgi:hypothetical protein
MQHIHKTQVFGWLFYLKFEQSLYTYLHTLTIYGELMDSTGGVMATR